MWFVLCCNDGGVLWCFVWCGVVLFVCLCFGLVWFGLVLMYVSFSWCACFVSVYV